MQIALTGTPGTGKTSVAEALGQELDSQVMAVNALADETATERDDERDAAIVDPEQLQAAYERRDIPGDAILEGHLAHHLPADVTVVLRCHPDELGERLRNKGWGERKVQENVEAEAIDVVAGEAMQERETVMEIDTTGKDPAAVAHEIADILTRDAYDDHAPGQVSWDLDEVFD